VPRVLFVLPAQEFWYPDFEPVRRVLAENGVQVTVAASRESAQPAQGGGGEPVRRDISLDQVRAADFNAVIFCGGPGVREFMGENWSGAFARKLIQEMVGQNKHVTALCMGTVVLAKAGILDGRRATGHSSIEQQVQEFGVALTGNPIEISDRVITARDANVAEQFARTVAGELRRK